MFQGPRIFKIDISLTVTSQYMNDHVQIAFQQLVLPSEAPDHILSELTLLVTISNVQTKYQSSSTKQMHSSQRWSLSLQIYKVPNAMLVNHEEQPFVAS
uniref:Uncharacterized protein n=1 Tax=Arundo donax TaxID=35708 RepID=A0A0A9F9F1_ARUDO